MNPPDPAGSLGPLSGCRAREVLGRIGDKWSLYVIHLLGGGTRRFSDLRRMIDGISQRMLTVTLRGLERDGLVTRTVYPTVPPRVDYDRRSAAVSASLKNHSEPNRSRGSARSA